MKRFMTMIFAFTVPLAFGAVEKPVCDEVGTDSEGWYLNGELMKDYRGLPALDDCSDKAVECSAVGTRSEGWHVFTKKGGKLLGWDKCSDREALPACEAIGTAEEGWYLDGRPIENVIGQPALGTCSDKYVECGLYSGRVQAWMVYEKKDAALLTWAKCGE